MAKQKTADFLKTPYRFDMLEGEPYSFENETGKHEGVSYYIYVTKLSSDGEPSRKQTTFNVKKEAVEKFRALNEDDIIELKMETYDAKAVDFNVIG